MRVDLQLIQNWIPDKARVLDLGCGDGELLQALKQRGVRGLGLEIDPENIQNCIAKGLSVVEQDLDHGLGNFADKSFDTVVMTQTLQAVHYPHKVLDELVRVGREGVVAFPNFAHWRCRAYLSIKGRMPVSKFMPYTWYDTPNIHFCTILDFEELCRDRGIVIKERMVVDQDGETGRMSDIIPNLFGITAIYRIASA